LDVVSCVAYGNDSQVQILIENNVLPPLRALLEDPARHPVHATVCFVISNICATNTDHAQAVIDAGIFPLIVAILKSKRTSAALRCEATWALCKVTFQVTAEQLVILAGQGVLQSICNMLSDTSRMNATPVEQAVLAIASVFDVLDRETALKPPFNINVLDSLWRLQRHETETIRQQAKATLAKHFALAS